MDLIVDTQILSYQFKGIKREFNSQSLAISSITANEFLLAQSLKSNKPDYYIVHPAKYSLPLNTEESGLRLTEHSKDPKWARRYTDETIIDFGIQFPAYREFGNEAISEIINDKHIETYKVSIASLPKQKQKYLLKRLKYILDSRYYCYSLTNSAIDQALNLFSKFVSENKYNCKDNVRNTINDFLILSTAIDRKKDFLTEDKLLNRFAAEYHKAPFYHDKNELLINFSEKQAEKRKSRESKEFIKKGWSYAIRNNREFSET